MQRQIEREREIETETNRDRETERDIDRAEKDRDRERRSFEHWTAVMESTKRTDYRQTLELETKGLLEEKRRESTADGGTAR